jgi:hypothetical protein
MNTELSDEEHEALGAMLHRGITEARAYAATPEGQAQLCSKLLELADSLWLEWKQAALVRLASERLDVLGATNAKMVNRIADLLLNNNEKHDRIIGLRMEMDRLNATISAQRREIEEWTRSTYNVSKTE